MPTALENFLFTHEYLFRQQTARYYPLSFDLIEQFADTWDFQLLCSNPRIRWDMPALQKWTLRIDWSALSGNKGITWTEELLNRYADRIDWIQLSQNPTFPFSEPIMQQYEARINWIYLSVNPALPLTDAFLGTYESKIFWPLLKKYNTNIQAVSARFQEKLKSLPDNHTENVFPLPDITDQYIKWEVKKSPLPPELEEKRQAPVSDLDEDFFERYDAYWEWRHLSGCVHLNWSTSFFERFYMRLSQEVAENPAFFEKVLQPVLHDALIERVCERLNPPHAVRFYYFEDQQDAFGMLPEVRQVQPASGQRTSNWDEWKLVLFGKDLAVPLPDNDFELSWFLRHPIRYADYHHWPYEPHYPAIVVSEKLKGILERFKLPPHHFYEISLAIPENLYGTETRTYYILVVPEQSYLYFDYSKVTFVLDQDRVPFPNRGPNGHRPYYLSSYFTRSNAPKYPETINTPDDFLAAREKLKEQDGSFHLRPIEYIWNTDFDLIACSDEHPYRRIWVSDNIRKAIEISGLTGMRFEQVWECRPRMLQLENEETRLEKEQILKALSAEYAQKPPEEEQITVRRYREMAAWAETVRSNKGLVKKLYEEKPPDVTNDPFIAAIRQREIDMDVVFPAWFVDMVRKEQLPEALSDFKLLSLESMYSAEIEDDSPITVKSVVFAEYSSQVLFLVLKVGSLYEMDDAIYVKEYDQGYPASMILPME